MDTEAAKTRSGTLELARTATPADTALEGLPPPVPHRYEVARVLGEGGMGTVQLCRDTVVGRDVALKALRSHLASAPDLVARFVREARVQGQLEHPSIVPVYDLGMHADGTAYFTMKRIRGSTLDAIVSGLAARDPAFVEKFPLRRLLSAFATVCLAVDFAHARGVLHRDLKPNNIMLGEFGEVNVLDWGIARVGDTGRDSSDESMPPVEVIGDATETQAGSLMGTPGYMSPEQAHGQLESLDARSDVYSLGCILFEILYLEPLHRGRTAMDRLVSTTTAAGLEARRARAGEVPPELERLWREACATNPAERVESSRELADRIERYLDGERDDARRRELAGLHIEAARSEDASTPEGRARTMRALGQALALDPTNRDAMLELSRMLTDLPTAIPDEAQSALREAEAARRLEMARATVTRNATWIALIPLVIAFGVTDWIRGGTLIASLLLAVCVGLFAWSRRAVDDRWTLSLFAMTSLTIALVSFVMGPFLIVPALAATNAVFYALHVRREHRPLVMAVSIATVIVPYATQFITATFNTTFVNDGVIVQSHMVHLPPVLSQAVLLIASVAAVATPTVIAGRMRDALAAAEERVIVQRHYLAQLLPKDDPRT